MTYKRVIGGETNEKSGKKWTKEELIQVYHLYKRINGVGLHEHNPEIQKLANTLGRTTRSTEAQTLMYRNLERGGDYSHGNMNKLCKRIWEEMETENLVSNDVISEISANYPTGLLDWAGHKRGGVKKPFDNSTGRPNGKVIRTQLTEKIDQWTYGINNESPRIILLIGGPGNGKTDALEYLISKIDSQYDTNYYSAISEQIKKAGDIVPRSLEIKLDKNVFYRQKLIIVQDASTGTENLSSEECLIRDLEEAYNGDSIYIACINRGILAEAVSKAENTSPQIYDLLNVIIQRLTQYISPKPLWPIDKKDPKLNSIAVWPMDVESLVQCKTNIEITPAFQIVKEAVNENRWACQDCTINKDYCPFFQNKQALQNKENVKGLLQILSDFELIANKRWTFREIFSLVSYIIVGSEHDFEEKTPCEWAREKEKFVHETDVKKRTQTIWELNEYLYHFRLFSKWPNFNSITRSNNGELKNILQSSDLTKEFFNYFSYNRNRKSYKPDIAKIIDNHFFSLIDPSQLSNEDNDFINLVTSVKNIEASFSYSVQAGYDLIKSELNPLEDTLFNQLIDLEKELDGSIRFQTSISSKRINELLVLIRSLSVRYFKRIHFSAKGISKDEIFLNEYRMLSPSKDSESLQLKKAKKLFDKLIQEKQGLKIVLNSSISQPQLAPDMEIKLEVNRVLIKHQYIIDQLNDVPRSNHKVLIIDFEEKFYIPLTYQLYKALHQLNDGVRPSSLPKEVLAMLDSIKSKLAGKIVRDPNILFNSNIWIGDSPNSYRIDEAENELELTIQEY